MEKLKQEAKELGIKGFGNMKEETLIAKIKEAKKSPETEEIGTITEKPQIMRRGSDVKVIGKILKKNLLYKGTTIPAGQICPMDLDYESLAKRGVI